MPIFAGGSLLAGLDLAHVQKNVQIAQYEKAIQSGFREVADALAGRGTLTSRSRRSACWWTPASAPTMCPTSASRQGIDNYLSVLDSQRSLYSAQQSLVDTRRARLSNLVNLYRRWAAADRAHRLGGGRGATGAKPPAADPRPAGG